MALKIRAEIFKVFGVNLADINKKSDGRSTKNHLASLIVSSFLICDHFYKKQTFEGTSNSSMVAEIERSIESNNAYDQTTGNIKPESINGLAKTISTIPLLRIFGDNLIYNSFVTDVYLSIRLSSIVGKSSLETLEALFEFEYKINKIGEVTLDNENIHYMVAIPRRRDYSYAFNLKEKIFLVADDQTAPVIMAGGLSEATNWHGGRLHIKENTIWIDDKAGGVQRDARTVVDGLKDQYPELPYHFMTVAF